MSTINYGATKKKRQTPKSLASVASALPDLTSNIVAECPLTVKRGRGRPRKAPEDKQSAYMGVKLTQARMKAYKLSAVCRGQTLPQWVTEHLDHASHYDPNAGEPQF